jgi:glycosyltransferase involved in cell wall biosynthesis
MQQIFLESHNLKNKYSGFGQFNYHLIKALANQDLQDLKITLNVKESTRWREEFGAIFDYNEYRSITRHKPFRIKKKYDLWHCLNQNIKIEPYFKIPYLLTVHDIHFVTEGSHGIQEKLKGMFREKLRRAHAIVYISEFTKKDTNAHFEVPDIPQYVIHNGNTIIDNWVAENYQPKAISKTPYLFSIGDFTERKNFISLVNMLRHLPEYNLVLSGNNATTYGEELRTIAEQNGLKDRVLLTGKVEDLQKKYYLQNCEAFVFPSLREGFGIPPIEAMRFGKPIFVSNNTSLPEIGGEHSFYWDHYESKYMARVFKNGMDTYKSNPQFYKDWYITRAKSFSWEKTAKQYLDVYKSILT